MGYTRKQFAAALEAVVPETYKVVPDPRSLGELDPAKDCYLQLVRQTIEKLPSNPLGNFSEKFELWVVEATTDPDESEDALDDKLAEVLAALDTIPWLNWSRAERRIHKSERHAYLISVELYSEKETQES